MKKTPLISVIVPIYNLQDYLENSLESLWKQTFHDFEVICINDGSTDDSLSILEKIAQKYPQMRVIDKPNGGVSSARNIGLEEAKGDYVYFLDADDIMHPQLLEILVSQIQGYDADIACCDYVKTEDLSYIEFANYHDVKTNLYQDPFAKFLEKEKFFSYSLWTKLYKRSIIGKQVFSENIHYGEDLLFNLEYFSKIKNIVKIAVPLYFYAVRSSSCVNTAFNDKKAQSFINLLLEIYYKFRYRPEYRLIRKNISSLSAKFLIKNIYDTSMAKKYAADLLALYELKIFDIWAIGIKKFIQLRNIFKQILKAKVLCHLHIFYMDQAKEFAKKLNKIKFDFSTLYITTPKEENIAILEKIFPKAKINYVENIGYDVYPFISLLKTLDLSGYDTVMHLHTKNITNSKKWRKNMISSLIGSKKIYEKDIQILQSSFCGLLGSSRCLVQINDHSPESTSFLKNILHKLNIELNPQNYFSIYGTMFLIKKDILQKILNFPFSKEDFVNLKEEQASLAHVYERLFCLYSQYLGFSVYGKEHRFLKGDIMERKIDD